MLQSLLKMAGFDDAKLTIAKNLLDEITTPENQALLKSVAVKISEPETIEFIQNFASSVKNITAKLDEILKRIDTIEMQIIEFGE